MVDKMNPIPTVNKNKHINENGNNKCHQLSPVPVAKMIIYKGINVNKKFIPTNRHFESGKMYFGMYTLLIREKLPTTLLIAKLEASLKQLKNVNPIIKQAK